MPKETIYSTLKRPEAPEGSQRVVDVLWGKPAGPDDEQRCIELHAYEKRYGRTEEIECIPLTRSDVNGLIRTLRKARDQAFGRDE